MSSAADDALVGLEPEVDAFIRALLDRAAAIRLPELFASRHSDAVYWIGDRHGVSAVGLRTASLKHDQLVAIMTFRLAQYLMANQLDPRLIHAQRLEHEPLSSVSSSDVHMIGGSADTGEILAYGTFKALAGVAPGTMMRERDRALFPVEEVFGPGLFDRLRILPDLPVDRVREAARLMKSHRHQALDALVTRATVEVLVQAFRLASGPLNHEIAAFVGDLELGVAKKSQDFCHLPTVILRGVVPYAPQGTFAFFNYQHRARYPYACLSSDISAERLTAIESALELAGHDGLAALFMLKRDSKGLPSSLTPPEGLPALDDAAVSQVGVPMAIRREMLDVGEWLRDTALFAGLSVAEAAVLSTLLERVSIETGTKVVRQGEVGDDIFLIESGTVDVNLTTPDGRYLRVRGLGPREYFGELALIAGGERTADVIATSPLTLLRLSRDAYERYLARLVEVERDLTKTALARSRDTLRAHKPASE